MLHRTEDGKRYGYTAPEGGEDHPGSYIVVHDWDTKVPLFCTTWHLNDDSKAWWHPYMRKLMPHLEDWWLATSPMQANLVALIAQYEKIARAGFIWH